MEKMKKIPGYLLGEVIILKNGNEIEVFKIFGYDSKDYFLKQIDPIVFDDPTEFRTLLRVA